MKKIAYFALFICFIFDFIECTQKEEQESTEPVSQKVITPTQKIVLWNGKDYSGWKLVLEDPGVDVKTVWSVKNGNAYCTGVPKGYMRTVDSYTNYKLHVEWRWPEEPGNSGVLLHCQEPDTVWPVCVEAQLHSGDAGDFILMGGTLLNEQVDKTMRRIRKKEESSEKAAGEWNTYDIICKDDTIKLFVNGVLQNVGTGSSVKSGFIALQSEGKPIEFRNIYLEPVE